MAWGCQRKENKRSGSIFSMMISNDRPSCCFWALPTSASTVVGVSIAFMRAPGAKGPLNFRPNQVPNSVESDKARQTRLRGARRRIFFSIRSVDMRVIGNLLVADWHGRGGSATVWLRDAVRSGGGHGALEATDQALVLVVERGGEASAELGEELAGVGQVHFPIVGFHAEKFTERIGGDVQAVEGESIG